MTIACGAISGFHSLISSGTTSKMLDKETDARFIGFGAMLAESLVGVMALIAACSMAQGDYFAINTAPAVFAKLGMHTVNLDYFSRAVGEKLAGRTGGAVSLAVGMAQIFRGLPGDGPADRLLVPLRDHVRGPVHFDHGGCGDAGGSVCDARITGQGVQAAGQSEVDSAGAPMRRWLYGWGYLIYTGNISTIWPLFGTGNQLLATIALAVVTVFLVNMGKTRYAWVTAAPALFVGMTTVTAGVLSIGSIFWPLTRIAAKAFQGYLDSALMTLFITGVVLVAADASRRFWKTLHGVPVPVDAFGAAEESTVKMGCC